MNIKIIKSGVSSVLAGLANVVEMTASLQGNVNEYHAKLNIDLAKDLLKSNCLWFESNPPDQNLSLNLNIHIEAIQNNEYLTRLHAAFSSSQKIFTVYCNGGEA